MLHAFAGVDDGIGPAAGLLADPQGNLFGTTESGGGGGCGAGCGTVFEVRPDGTETVAYAFQENLGDDGPYPRAGVIQDTEGNLYGTTFYGGPSGGCFGQGCGTVFEITASGTESILYAFNGHLGELPQAALIMDNSGNLYGTTSDDFVRSPRGTAFMLTPNGTASLLYEFKRARGRNPVAGLILDKKGNLYGTAKQGGASRWGTVFELTPGHSDVMLYSFLGPSFHDGAYPTAGVIHG